MSVTWSDIQRLAADLQRVQLTSESKRLSVKNCVEVVSILIKSGRLDVFFTIDGQFYVTKKHLLTEIKNECISTGGRIPLSSLVQALNIDYGAIESGVRTIVKHSSAFVLYNAELISKEYNNNLYVELNELLFESGVLSVLQLVKAWSLPLQFLNDFIFVEIGKKIKAIRDGDFIYTHEYFTEQKNLIRAIFNSLTKVTSVSKIMGTLNITTHLFWMLFDEQLAAHEIPGRIIGSRNSSLVLYMPNLHTELSRTYVAKTFASRQFIEMNVLKRLSIIDVPSFLQETLPPAVHKSLIFLTHTIISEKLLEEIFEALNTELSTTNFVDIRNCVPNQLESHSDTLALSSLCLKKNKDWFSSSDQLILYNNSLISETIKALDSFVNATAETEAKNIRIAQISNSRAKEKANEDNSAVTKGKKKAGKAKLQKQISTVERTTSPRLSTSAVMDELKRMKLFPEELIDDISEHIILQLDLRLRQRVLELLHTARSEAFVDHKRAYMQMQTKVSCMFESICVFEEGTSIFNEAVACDLRAYLMRTLCTDLAYDLLSFATGVDNISRNSVKIRDESIACIESKSGRETIGNLFTCLTTADLSAYHSELMRTCSTDMCSFNLKLPDKKRRAEIVEAYGNDMKRRLEACEDTASGLLIALLLIFAIEYKSAVHGSGKFVSHFIRKLATLPHFCSSTYDIILDIQRCVIDSLKRKDTEAITSLGRENLEKLKAILLNESTSHCVSDIS